MFWRYRGCRKNKNKHVFNVYPCKSYFEENIIISSRVFLLRIKTSPNTNHRDRIYWFFSNFGTAILYRYSSPKVFVTIYIYISFKSLVYFERFIYFFFSFIGRSFVSFYASLGRGLLPQNKHAQSFQKAIPPLGTTHKTIVRNIRFWNVYIVHYIDQLTQLTNIQL